jgi:hypothetical protein
MAGMGWQGWRVAARKFRGLGAKPATDMAGFSALKLLQFEIGGQECPRYTFTG